MVVEQHLLSAYNVTLIKHDMFEALEQQARVNAVDINRIVFTTAIEEVSFELFYYSMLDLLANISVASF